MRVLLVISIVVLYLVLVIKNPFSNRTLIPNLEPYPDTFYYSLPAWNFLHGKGFVMSDGEVDGTWITPPVYSLWLVPFFAVVNDVRIYFLANVLLGVLTILCFYVLLKNVYDNGLFVWTTLFVWVTSYYTYILPQLLMAENMSLLLVTAGLCVLFVKRVDTKVFLLVLFAVLLFLTKFSNLPLSFGFIAISMRFVVSSNNRLKYVWSVAPLLFLGIYLLVSRKFNNQVNLQSGTSFSVSYFQDNFIFYIKTCLGWVTHYLWYQKALFLPGVAPFGLVGCFLFLKKSRLLPTVIFIMASTTLVFMSFFYFPDARYVHSLAPLFYLFMLYPFYFLIKSKYVYGLLFTFLLLYSLSSYKSLKLQVALNYKYAETPWNFVAIQNDNIFFKNASEQYLYSFLPRYYFYYFSNKNYIYRPLVNDGRFDKTVDAVSDIKNLLSEGKKVYLSDAYKMNNIENQKLLEYILTVYTYKPVLSACENTCNIYEILPIKK